jgi:hypothetical protein
MPRPLDLILFSALVFNSLTVVRAQDDPVPVNRLENLKTLAFSTNGKSESVIVVPPATSVTIGLSSTPHEPGSGSVDVAKWLTKEAASNGLDSADLQPWHIVVTYDQFDEDGDNVHSGVYEEYWADAKKYKRIYKSDNFNQTDYATDKGLYRRDDQHWPDKAQSQVRAEILAPFSYAATLEGFSGRNVERSFSG